jgi:polyisoprenoid-binding protein YceI
MKRDVLDVASFPEITYQAVDVPAEAIARGEFRLHIDGRLTIHGVTRPQHVEARLKIFQDGLLLSGECPVRLSDHRIPPVTALGGTIALKDELHLEFELFAPLEGS